MKLFVGMVVGLMLVGLVSADAQMSRGTVENALARDENKNCEYLSIQDGVDTPIRFAMNFPSTPNVTPEITATDAQSQFASDFTNEGFFFSTNATDLFTIRLNIDYENPDSSPRNFFYELFVGGGFLKQVGNWQENTQSFCKIIELNARPAPHILSDDEIIETIAGYEKIQHTETQRLINAILDLIAIIVVAGVTTSLTFIVIMVFMKMSKSKDSKEAIYVSQQFSKQTDNFRDTMGYVKKMSEYGDIKVDYIVSKIEGYLKDVMWGMKLHNKTVKESAFKVHPILTVKEEEKVTEGMGFLDKAKEVITDQLEMTKKKADTTEEKLYAEFNEMTDEQVNKEYEKMYKSISKYNSDPEFKQRFDILMLVVNDRNGAK